MTKEEIINSLPKGKRKSVPVSVIERIISIAKDEKIANEFRENFFGYIDVVQDGRFSVEEYLNAVLFVTHKLLGAKDVDAWARVFPKRYQKLMASETKKYISNYVSAYKKSKLVSKIFEQSIVPSWVLNAPYYQEAINFQVRMMREDEVPWHVRQKAADSLLMHLKPPETAKIELDIGIKKDNVVEEYEENIRKLVEKQKELIEAGADVKMIANSGVRSAEEKKEEQNPFEVTLGPQFN